jgi:hypothetical protein
MAQPYAAKKRVNSGFVFCAVLTPAHLCWSISTLHLWKFVEYWLQASRAIAPDHMVEVGQQQLRTRMSAGSHLVRENGTTGHKAMTLPKRKVTAQVAENCSC